MLEPGIGKRQTATIDLCCAYDSSNWFQNMYWRFLFYHPVLSTQLLKRICFLSMKQYHFCQEFGNRALIWIEESLLSLPCAVLVMGKELSVWVIFLSRKQSSPIAREEWTSSRLICDGWLNANLATLLSATQRIQNATGYSYTGTL